MKIKKGDKFECILDYEMEDGAIVFFNGKIYTSKKDNTLPSLIDETHVMNEEQDFKLHFKRLKSKSNNKLAKAIKLLETHNKWRRGDGNLEMTNPAELGKAIDLIVNKFKKKQKIGN